MALKGLLDAHICSLSARGGADKPDVCDIISVLKWLLTHCPSLSVAFRQRDVFYAIVVGPVHGRHYALGDKAVNNSVPKKNQLLFVTPSERLKHKQNKGGAELA